MQNDISVEQVKNDTKKRQEQLEKMKKNIEALQINMNKKKSATKTNTQTKPPQPLFINHHRIDSQSSAKSPQNQQYSEFAYNSTLFKNIGNQSQPIMENGSAVSNFSSVSNINNLLNNNHNQRQEFKASLSPARQNDKILYDIDKVLEKVQKSHKLPTKTLEKIIDNREDKPNRSIPLNQSLTVSKMANSSGQLSARTKIQQFKNLINKLDTIHEETNKNQINLNQIAKKQDQYYNDQKLGYKKYAKTFQPLQLQTEQINYKSHKKDQPSNITYKSQYPVSQNYSKFPPTPPIQPKSIPKSATQRQKALIKRSVQEYKKLQSQHPVQLLDKSDIDFELSDEEQQKQKSTKNNKVKQLLKQKQSLELQLKKIQEQIKTLQAYD